LSDVEKDKGGETVFPLAKDEKAPTENCCDESACPNALRIHPKKGDAVLFYNLQEEGHHDGINVDHRTLHEACPVTEGEKWSAKYWVRNKRVNGKLYSGTW